MNALSSTSQAQTGDMLPQRPPPKIISCIAGLLISLCAVAAVAAFMVQVPETVRCPFILVPENGADPVQSPLLSVVQAVKVAEGTEVQQGEELFVLRSDEIRGWQTQLQLCQE